MDVAEAVKHVRLSIVQISCFVLELSDDVPRQVRGQGEAQLELFGFVTRATQSL